MILFFKESFFVFQGNFSLQQTEATHEDEPEHEPEHEQKVAILQKTQENDGLHEEHEQEASGQIRNSARIYCKIN